MKIVVQRIYMDRHLHSKFTTIKRFAEKIMYNRVIGVQTATLYSIQILYKQWKIESDKGLTCLFSFPWLSLLCLKMTPQSDDLSQDFSSPSKLA